MEFCVVAEQCLINQVIWLFKVLFVSVKIRPRLMQQNLMVTQCNFRRYVLVAMKVIF